MWRRATLGGLGLPVCGVCDGPAGCHCIIGFGHPLGTSCLADRGNTWDQWAVNVGGIWSILIVVISRCWCVVWGYQIPYLTRRAQHHKGIFYPLYTISHGIWTGRPSQKKKSKMTPGEIDQKYTFFSGLGLLLSGYPNPGAGFQI